MTSSNIHVIQLYHSVHLWCEQSVNSTREVVCSLKGGCSWGGGAVVEQWKLKSKWQVARSPETYREFSVLCMVGFMTENGNHLCLGVPSVFFPSLRRAFDVILKSILRTFSFCFRFWIGYDSGVYINHYFHTLREWP